MRRKKYRLRTATPLVAVIAGLAAAEANAQSQDSADLGEVVVTGTKAVVKSPGAIKQQQQPIVDSITANELESLPDASVADALERVVGVSSAEGYQTAAGRTVTIRGFDSRYNSMDVDGNTIWNASRNNRGTQLDIFPSGVISQINVYKTVTPDMDANSIGGHVELRTLRAFDGGGEPYLRVKAEVGGYEQSGVDGNDGPSYKISAVGKRTLGTDDQFGVVFGAELQQLRLYQYANNVGGYAVVNGVDVVNDSMFQGIYNEDVQRQAVYGKLEAGRPDHLYGFLSLAYYRTDDLEVNSRSGPYLTASKNVTDISQGQGTFTKVPDEAYDERYDIDRRTVLVGSGLDYALGARQKLSFRADYTRYDHRENQSIGERFEAPTVTGTYDLGDDTFGAVVPPTDNVADAGNWVYRNKNASTVTHLPDIDNVVSAKLGYDYNTQADARGLGFAAGAMWRRLDRNFDETRESYMLPKGTTLNLAQVLAGGVTTATALGPNYIDDNAFWSYIESNGTLSINTYDTADYHLKEDVFAGNATIFYSTERFRALLGYRLEKTLSDDSTSDVENSITTPERRRYDYSNWLPNVQLQGDITRSLRAKLAFTETIARPDFQDYAMGRTVTVDEFGHTTISGTNPYLTPRFSRNFDFDLESYFRDGFASLGVFRKNLEHEEFKESTKVTDDAGVVILTQTMPLNTGSGRVDGLEANLVLDRMSFLPGPLENLYFSANYTRLIGHWNVVFTDGSTRDVPGLRNQPTYLANVKLGYEGRRFAVHGAVNVRGRMFTGTYGTSPDDDYFYRPVVSVSAGVDFKIDRNVRIFFEGSGLNNPKKQQYTGVDEVITNAIWSGRSFWGGVKVKL